MDRESESPVRRPDRLVRHIVAAALTLGLAADLLLRAGPWGLNATLWTAAFVMAAWALALHHRPARPSFILRVVLPVLLLLAIGFAWRDSEALKAMNVLGILLVVAVWSLAAEGIAVRRLGVLEYARGLVTAAIAAVAGAVGIVREERAWSGGPAGRWDRVRGSATGLLIAFPLLFVFGGLLMAADAVFDRMVARALSFDVANVASHMAVVAVFTWMVAGFLLWTMRTRGWPTAIPGRLKPPRLGITEIGIPLTLLDLLFLAFVVIQLRYLFGDSSLVEMTTGLTYSEYARRGFFELVAVCALVLPVLLAADSVLSDRDGRARRFFRILTAVQLALLLVIVASALQRMRLYVAAYGLTELRVYATAFMAWVAGVLGWFAVTVLRGRRDVFAGGAAVAGLLVLGLLNVVNPDGLIARINLDRAASGQTFDAKYNARLSADAVPALVSGLAYLRPDDRCRVAERLLARWSPATAYDWRTWDQSRARARRIIESKRPRLTELTCAASGSSDGAQATARPN